VRQSRFFVPFELHVNERYTMPDNIGHYMSRVLRLPIGAQVTLFTGDNHEYSATICEISKKFVTLEVAQARLVNRESPLNVHLIQAVSKGDKLDWVFQKSVELGVSHLIPVTTSRTSFSLSGARLDKKIQHWQGVISSACEQCGRNKVPDIRPVEDVKKVISEYKNHSATKIVLNPLTTQSLRQINVDTKELVLLIGPEGGLSEEEICFAEQNGFISCVLGDRILRTETAALTMLSLAQGFWGDLC